jgi:hypothetical protein
MMKVVDIMKRTVNNYQFHVIITPNFIPSFTPSSTPSNTPSVGDNMTPTGYKLSPVELVRIIYKLLKRYQATTE